MVSEELKYTKKHEWLRLNDGEAVIGITDHAQSELGDITFIELPEEGKQVKRGDTIVTIESVKAASDVYSPVSGEIVATNKALEDAPETVNRSAYEDGWICRIKVADVSETGDLMDLAAYEEYLKTL